MEAPEPGDMGEDGGLEAVDTRIAIRRYLCVVCETTCTVLPAELRVHADILRPTVATALALWVLHPDGPSTAEVRQRLFGDRRSVVGGWPQLRRWAHTTAELIGPDEVVAEDATPKRRAAEIIQICRARAPPELRETSPWSRAFAGAKHPQ